MVISCFFSCHLPFSSRMTFKIAWSEALLSMIHSLLDSKVCECLCVGKVAARLPSHNIHCY